MSNRSRSFPGLDGFSPSFPVQLFRQQPGFDGLPQAPFSPVYDVPSFPVIPNMPAGSPIYQQPPYPPLTDNVPTLPVNHDSHALFDIARIYDSYKFGNAVHLPISCGNNAEVLPASASLRVHLMIQNQSTNDIYFAFGCDASLNNGVSLGVKLSSGGTAFYDAFVPQNGVNIFCATPGSPAILVFAMKPAPQ